MSRLTVGSLEGLSENSNVISVPTGHKLNVADAGALQIGGSGVVSAGLVFISRTTIGTAVSSVTVSDCFSSTYDNYRIFVHGEANSAGSYFQPTLGSATTGYYRISISGLNYSVSGGALVGYGTQNGSSFVGFFSMPATTGATGFMELQNPYLTKWTHVQQFSTIQTAGSINLGVLQDTTSHTSITFTPNTGTVTGGYIDVYGYAKA
jgi:hypothetical protein